MRYLTPICATGVREGHDRELIGLTPDDQRLVAGVVEATARRGVTAPPIVPADFSTWATCP